MQAIVCTKVKAMCCSVALYYATVWDITSEKLDQFGVPHHEATCPKMARSVQTDEDLRAGLGIAFH